MESLLVGSFAKPSSVLPFPVAAELSSLNNGSYVALRESRCRAWNILDRKCVVRFQQHLVMCHVGSFSKKSAPRQRSSTKYLMNAASEQPLGSEPEPYHPKSPSETVQDALHAFYRFSRPHTVIGTALSIISVSLLAVEKLSDFSPLLFSGVLEAIVPALLMNIYIVGLNQLSDIEIDKVNKPYLPLASGEFTITTGVFIVSAFLLMSFFVGWIVGSWPLFWALSVSFLLGTAYSIDIPLLRWKRFALVAAMCILAVRAIIVQIAFYLHVQTYVFGRPAILSKPVLFATGFMSFFSVVIALFKDIPDIVGDKIYGIKSFTVRLGQERVFWICISLLQMAYAVAVLVGASSSCIWSKYITVLGHMMLASLLWSRAISVDLGSKSSITSFYMFIWKLFYAEYLLIPLERIIAYVILNSSKTLSVNS
ncbi:hypothetical protein RJ639_027575 [Escallonia herrerae]|uniref:Homogentisate phytyltransferase n=1 Tax=Escallonia herrerae TaxID=1293975 RepID=A0AA88XD75_9ASTE|nr:hypothetical protein RJ639_027575 [Escallonia herrerae]